MDDTIAMQDSNIRVVDPSVPANCNEAGSTGDNLTSVALKLQSASQPSTPQHQQGGADASSVASDSSSQEQSRSVRLSAGTGHADVDAAKQAALSALAGLDMTTTKANLDASKAAAATARANGEIPTHPRKSNLRSVSCRQLGSSSSAATNSTPTAGKSVGFDDTAKSRAPADAARAAQGQWRGPTALTSTADGQPRRANRPPASRCFSLPAHVLQSRVGMANRLAASYAPDASALQQQPQFQLLNGSAGLQNYNFQQQLHQATLGHPADTLTVYQLQHHGLTGPPPSSLLSHRGFGAPGLAVDDSVQSGNIMLQQQQQQQQQQLQQARMAQGSWVPAPAGAQTGLTRWGSGQLAQPNAAVLAQAQAVNANAQLLAQLQATSQAQQGGDALWMAAPASAGLQLSSNPQGMMLQPQAAVSGAMQMSGIPGLQQQQLIAQLQPAGTNSMAAAAAPSSGGGAISATALLESYQSVSWSVLAAAQGEAALRDQLLTELVLLLTMLHTLSNTLKGSITAADALNDFSYLAGAARRHMATFSRLSQAGNIAVQLLALITPFALRHSNSAELIEAAFLVLDTLALANRDVANVVAQQRLTALAAVGIQLPVEQLLQQQQVGLAWITNLAGAVSRNKSMLESMGGDGSSQGGAAGGSAALVQNANMSGGLLSAGMGVPASHAMLLGQQAGAPLPSTTFSPTRKTPLATYFEEAAQGTAAAGTAGAAAASAAAGGLAGLGGIAVAPPGMRVGAGTPPGTRLGDALLADQLNGVTIVSAAPTLGQDLGQVAQDAAAAGQLGLSDLEQLAGLSLGMGSAAAQAGAGVGQHAAAPGSTGTYSPLGGGLSLFGESPVLVPGGGAGSSGPSSTGATNMVGV